MIKLLPKMDITKPIWVWIFIIALIKTANVGLGFILRGKFTSEHTLMNKITGVLLFLLPFTLPFIEVKYSGAAVCSIATVSAAQEGYYIITGREID